MSEERDRAYATISLFELALSVMERISVECGDSRTQKMCEQIADKIKADAYRQVRRYDKAREITG